MSCAPCIVAVFVVGREDSLAEPAAESAKSLSSALLFLPFEVDFVEPLTSFFFGFSTMTSARALYVSYRPNLMTLIELTLVVRVNDRLLFARSRSFPGCRDYIFLVRVAH
jgi:hypothetical protein